MPGEVSVYLTVQAINFTVEPVYLPINPGQQVLVLFVLFCVASIEPGEEPHDGSTD